MSNNLSGLNDHLFTQLDRLNNSDLSGDALAAEIERSKAIVDVSKSVISNASLQLDAVKLKAEYKGLASGDMVGVLAISQQ